jgi:lysophospholipase L1-like esterase
MSKKLLFALLPLFVVFFAVEVGLRVSDWPKVTAAFEHKEPFWTIDPDLINKKMPHKEEGTSFLVNSNADSLRTRPLSELEDFDFRIMTMGCSTTFGWGVSDVEAYPARLESYIHGEGHKKTAVINAGQPGYTSFQGSWLWDRTLKNYKPDVVLIGFVVQDARKAAYTDRSQAILQKDYRFLKENVFYNSRVYLGLRSAIGSVQIQAKERGSGDIGGVFRVPPEDYVYNLRSLITSVREGGGTPILFGYPLERSGYTSEHRMILKAAAAELDVLLLDPQSKMEEAARLDQFYFSRDRGHANAAGNDLIAQWVFAFLKEHDLLEKK